MVIMLKNRLKPALTAGYAVFALFALTLLAPMLLAGCSRTSYSRSLKLPPDSALGGGSWWFLVTADYAQTQIQPGTASSGAVGSSLVIRKGTILECSERRISPQGLEDGLLYRFKDNGHDYWVSEKFGQAYFSLQEAEKARADR